jgi:hypothetical protein
MSDLFNDNVGALVALAVALLVHFLYSWLMSTKENNNGQQPPQAQPCLPFLGNALHYKDHPDEFLSKQAALLGEVFTVNLAGLKTTILSSKATMKQFALTSERILSSRAAVADFGFRYTLGGFIFLVHIYINMYYFLTLLSS